MLKDLDLNTKNPRKERKRACLCLRSVTLVWGCVSKLASGKLIEMVLNSTRSTLLPTQAENVLGGMLVCKV